MDKIERVNQKAAPTAEGFLKKGIAAAGAATVGAGLLVNGNSALAEEGSSPTDAGDASILRFLAAAEILETDLWQQYNELAGIQDKEVPGGTGNPAYTAAIKVLDGDMDQYIHDNTEDELTHEQFINLASKGRYCESRSLPSSAKQQSDRRAADRTADKPDAAFCGHYLVHPLSQSHEKSRLRRQLSSSNTNHRRRPTSGNPQNGCGHQRRESPSSNC